MRLTLLIVLAMNVVSSGASRSQSMQTDVLMFVADLQGQHVAPAAVQTAATAKASAVLVGNRFTVHGSFSGLSSPLRDITKKPDDPGVHLHRGAPSETSPNFHGLQVKLNADERSGIFFGTATLTDDQRKALLGMQTYVDIHTVKNGPGEVRDQWRPVDAAAATRTLAGLERSAPTLMAAKALAGDCH
jgi:hypothetical protein